MLVAVVLFTLLFSSSMLCQSVNVLTNRYDNSRSGANLTETVLNTSNVNTKQFGKLFEREVDGDLYAQPLIATNIEIAGKGKRNVVYLATANNSVYAYDADDRAASAPYWHITSEVLGKPVPRDDVVDFPAGQHYLNFERSIGITSTPVIDLETHTIYVVVKSKEGKDNYIQSLHALDLATGHERGDFHSPVNIEAAVSGNGIGSSGGTIHFSARKNLNRAGLLLLDGVIYVAFGSHDDDEPMFQYHGWILAYDAKTLRQIAAYCTTPDGIQGGIWQSGGALAADAGSGQKFVYAAVGNGSLGGRDYGESVIKLIPGSALSVQHAFAPPNAAYLNGRDLDLSTGAVLLPRTNWLLACSKQGRCYLLDRSDMHLLQEIQASMNTVGTSRAPNIHGSPVFWCSPCDPNQPFGLSMFLWGEEDYMRAFRLDMQAFIMDGQGFVSSNQSTMHAPKSSMPGAVLTLSASGWQPGTGIVWASHPVSADANNKTVEGILRAFDANDISRELWNSNQIVTRDNLGMFAKFCPPVVANGKVYIATFAEPILGLASQDPPKKPNKLVVFGLL
jgi:hypothetical protein